MSRSGFRRGDRARANARFRALPAAIRSKVEDALVKNAEELTKAIQRRVPQDTGDLAGTVRWLRGKGAGGRGTRVGAAGRDSDISVRVVEGDRNSFYAWFVEHGTVNFPAQPHFFPTYRQLQRKLKSRLTRAVRDVIKAMAAAGIR